tara:strand:+ start:1034 stop:1510 length:477 start_codon:yes stop_codon:yes gene_type:complete
MIQTKLINILKQLPRTSAKGTEKVVNREAKSVETIIDEFSLSDRADAVGDAGEDALLSSQEDYSGNITDIDETPETLKKEPVYFDKKDKRFQYKDKDRETKEKNKKSKSQPISPPTPTPAEYAMYLQYNKKGIFFKTNLKDLNNRDKNGLVIINIGDE